ncbi:IS66 family transposase [Methylobacterium sp. 13MFTsu3.1M2]|uniref:IS66 family transposase n=1 Tax=Methylobacterium oryzae TaxID=334852 RepID=UPI000B861B63
MWRWASAGGRVLRLTGPEGELPLTHLAAFSGVFEADGYAGFDALYKRRRSGSARFEAACRAHTRRKSCDVHASTGSAVAFEALERMGASYEVESDPFAASPPRAPAEASGLIPTARSGPEGLG